MPWRRVGEKVPEVVRPRVAPSDPQDGQLGSRDSAVQREQAPEQALRSPLPLGQQHLAPPEGRLRPADGPPRRCACTGVIDNVSS